MTSQNGDLVGLGRDAADMARELAVDDIREKKESLIQSPAMGRKLSRVERVAQNRALLDNPGSVEAQFDEMSARFQLTPEKPIPRRLVNRLRRAAKELAEEDDDAARTGA